ncbi:DUF4920 domain-containing protein [Shewanella sp. WXL01]|uniref:DUF4920 domain-containing protein n=1 Tax=Shewanella maritima TaxID=2520507 RepID=A0A411PGR2_9GAMM|nr:MULTISPECIES: DUF4920 domain-containing protein [Shewanella]NKF49132.1 DUF4920 domain-containing protein [Shewanella sp. WXL01]QBF82743.1 DUF4920 domain-containing protein [Shewanella maritima]
MKLRLTVAASMLCGALIAPMSALATDFGSGVNQDLLVPVSTLMADPESYLENPVTIEGTIVGVCEHRGCWMTIASDKRFESLRIKVKDGEMVFPLTARGKKALATGKLQALRYNLEQTKEIKAYYAKEAGEEFDPASVTEPMTMYQLVPTGVSIAD